MQAELIPQDCVVDSPQITPQGAVVGSFGGGGDIDDSALAAHAFAEGGIHENLVVDAVFLAAFEVEGPLLTTGIFGSKAAE